MAKKQRLPVATKQAETQSTMPTIDKDREMKYRAEDALRDIERAKKHESDRDLMKHVKKLAKEKIKCLDKI